MKMIAIPGQNYEIGETTVTQSQWREVMGTEPWKGQSYVMEGEDYPAVYVSWDDAVAFCKKLSEKESKTYRLPTEEEWEYACRAGATTAYYFGDNATELGEYAWFDKNTWDIDEKYAHRVGRKLPNGFGLYDMHGNVWEWCNDWCNDWYNENLQFPVMRGGSWLTDPEHCSAWHSDYGSPDSRHDDVGFRLVRI